MISIFSFIYSIFLIIFMVNPMYFILGIMMFSILFSITFSLSMNFQWILFFIVLVFVGGMMVLFIYVISISPKFYSFSNKFYTFYSVLIIPIFFLKGFISNWGVSNILVNIFSMQKEIVLIFLFLIFILFLYSSKMIMNPFKPSKAT